MADFAFLRPQVRQSVPTCRIERHNMSYHTYFIYVLTNQIQIRLYFIYIFMYQNNFNITFLQEMYVATMRNDSTKAGNMHSLSFQQTFFCVARIFLPFLFHRYFSRNLYYYEQLRYVQLLSTKFYTSLN